MAEYFSDSGKIEKFFTKILGLKKNILLPFRGNYYIVYDDTGLKGRAFRAVQEKAGLWNP